MMMMMMMMDQLFQPCHVMYIVAASRNH